MGALVACENCGFITRRHSRIGVDGECPHCRRELTPVSFSAARKLQIRKHKLRSPLENRESP
jgi:predicted Zn-ribbon and HTH transcriptional regulator